MTASKRDSLRSAIFASDVCTPKSELVEFFGQQVEVRQPSVDTVLSIRSAASEDRKSMMVDMIIAYVYVPDSDEKLFEDADRDQLLSMPFGQDMTRLQKAISLLTNLDLATEAAAKN